MLEEGENNIGSSSQQSGFIPPEPQPQPQTPEDDEIPFYKKKIFILGSVVAVLLIALLLTWAFYTVTRMPNVNKQPSKPPSHSNPGDDSSSLKEIMWIDPQEVPNLQVFDKAVSTRIGAVNTYYKVATTKYSEEIYLVRSKTGASYKYYRFKKDSLGKLSFLKAASDPLPPDAGFLKEGTPVDDKTTYKELEIPQDIKLTHGGHFKKLYEADILQKIQNTSKVEDTNNGAFYVSLHGNVLGSVDNRNFYLKLADSSTVEYNLVLDYFDKAVGIPDVTFDDTKNTTRYSSYSFNGCAGFDSTVIDNFDAEKSKLTPIGQFEGGEEIYTISNVKSGLAEALYSVYKEANEKKLIDQARKELRDIPIEKFFNITPRSVFFIKDPIGQYMIFYRNDVKAKDSC